MTAKGSNIKLGTNYKLIEYIENGIKKERKSLEILVEEIQRKLEELVLRQILDTKAQRCYNGFIRLERRVQNGVWTAFIVAPMIVLITYILTIIIWKLNRRKGA